MFLTLTDESRHSDLASSLARGIFLKALNQLEKAQQEPYSEFIRDAVIQRFEFTYELAWKTLKVYTHRKISKY